jgi:hypothetical protein
MIRNERFLLRSHIKVLKDDGLPSSHTGKNRRDGNLFFEDV